MTEIRQQIKRTSIEKKQKIINAGLQVFSEKGYYNTTTAEIAQIAGVSTGIVYNYFKDKKDILLQALQVCFENTFKPILNALNQCPFRCDVEGSIRKFVLICLQAHNTENKFAHREIMGMCMLDQDAGALLNQKENNVINAIIKALSDNGITAPNITAKIKILYHIIRDFCHTAIFENHSENYINTVLNEILEIAKNMFFS